MICGSKLIYQVKNDCIQRKHSIRLTKKKNPRAENKQEKNNKNKDRNQWQRE